MRIIWIARLAPQIDFIVHRYPVLVVSTATT